jgi:hypothetical protein
MVVVVAVDGMVVVVDVDLLKWMMRMMLVRY